MILAYPFVSYIKIYLCYFLAACATNGHNPVLTTQSKEPKFIAG